ncbi:PHP domain-containing protein [Candidatus Woesearchaeota archaeon]|nr:PHP domain-containing protein [Candidatus Woesearchaeota archaeon]
MKKLDLHVHTRFSRDSSLDLKLLARIIKKLDLYLAITDHNTIRGAVVFRKNFKGLRSRVIVGEEVKTLQGEVIGLFLQEEVKPFRDVFETIDEIRSQGGLVLVPHPFDMFRRSRLRQDLILKLKPDIIEVFNARTILNKYNVQAFNFAKKHNLLMSVGSDSHFWFEIGSCYALVNDVSSPKALLKSLRKASFYYKRNILKLFTAHAFSKVLKTFPKIKAWI